MCKSNSAPKVSPKTESDSSPSVEIGTFNEVVTNHDIHLPTIYGCVIIIATVLVAILVCFVAKRYKSIFFQDHQECLPAKIRAQKNTVNDGNGRERAQEDQSHLEDTQGVGQMYRYSPEEEKMVPVPRWWDDIATGAGANIVQGDERTAIYGRISKQGPGTTIHQRSVPMVALPTSRTGGTPALPWCASLTNIPRVTEMEDNRIIDLDSIATTYMSQQRQVANLELEIAHIKRRLIDQSPPPPNRDDNMSRASPSAQEGTKQEGQGPADNKARRRASTGKTWEQFLRTDGTK